MAPIGLRIFYKAPGNDAKNELLYSADDLAAYMWMTRGTVKEAMNFSADLVVQKLKENERLCVEHQDKYVYAYLRDTLAIAFICDQKYNDRVAHRLMENIHSLFLKDYPPSMLQNLALQKQTLQCPQILDLFTKSKNPVDVDQMERIRQDLDETCSIMHKNIESVLERGEKLDDLVERSNYLTSQSKQFYKTAKQTNSCCTIL